MITPAIEKATTNLSTVKNNLLFRPVDKCIILPYSQLLNLAPMYALAILTHLEALDKESKLLTLDFHHFKSVWGFQFPSKLVLASERTKTTDVFDSWTSFSSEKIKQWAKDFQTEFDVYSSRETLKQIAALIGYAQAKKVEMTQSFCTLAYAITSCMILNYKDIFDSEGWRDSLREIQVILKCTTVVRDNVEFDMPGTVLAAIRSLSISFSRLVLPVEMVFKLKAVFMKTTIYAACIDRAILKNIARTSKLLLSVTNTKDLEKSSRWFREMCDAKKRSILMQVGIQEYIKAQGEGIQPDSVLLANYIKALLRKIEFGLIPDPVKDLLIWLVADKDVIDSDCVSAVVSLLSISADRFQVLRDVSLVAMKIFQCSTTGGSISPTALASVIQVTSDELPIGLDQDQIKAQFKEWHATFGLILANPEVFRLS